MNYEIVKKYENQISIYKRKILSEKDYKKRTIYLYKIKIIEFKIKIEKLH